MEVARWISRHGLFLHFLVVVTLFAAFYFFRAMDRFEATGRFMIPLGNSYFIQGDAGPIANGPYQVMHLGLGNEIRNDYDEPIGDLGSDYIAGVQQVFIENGKVLYGARRNDFFLVDLRSGTYETFSLRSELDSKLRFLGLQSRQLIDPRFLARRFSPSQLRPWDFKGRKNSLGLSDYAWAGIYIAISFFAAVSVSVAVVTWLVREKKTEDRGVKRGRS